MLRPFSALYLGLIAAAAVPATTALPTAAAPAGDVVAWNAPHAGNPLLPGYFADPSLVRHEGKFYLFATLDPWGGATLGCWESADFRRWEFRALNWPTKAACTSPSSIAGTMVWAPSVVRAANGAFFLYVSVGSEIWVGRAAHPLGPWTDANGGRPLVSRDYDRAFHQIDAEAFVDDDGAGYLVWGSGWNWTNGRCYGVKLKPDMVTFDGAVKVLTPPDGHYFEGPFLAKRGGKYFLTYSDGKTVADTYCVHYAVGDAPLGPFTEAKESLVLGTDRARDVVSPGHHALFAHGGRDYILYHRHRVPYQEGTAFRQVCVDEIVFRPDGRIERVAPTHAGPAQVRGRADPRNWATAAQGATATASSELGELHRAAAVLDDNYATRWAAAAEAKGAWLQLDLGAVRPIARQELVFEYAWKPVRFVLEASRDGTTWVRLHESGPASAPVGSPLVVAAPVPARFLRLGFPADQSGDAASLWEWVVLP